MLSFAVCSCRPPYDAREYRGDGVLDAKPFAKSGWASQWVVYTLKLGPVDLSSSETRRYSMVSLPPQRFSIWFAITAKDRSAKEREPWFDSNVRVRIVDASGHVVCEGGGRLRPLKDRTSGPASASEDVAEPDDVTEPDTLTWAPSNGPQSCDRFEATRDAAYKVEVVVQEPDSKAKDFDVRLELYSYPK